MTNSDCPDQIIPRSSLTWAYTVCSCLSVQIVWENKLIIACGLWGFTHTCLIGLDEQNF